MSAPLCLAQQQSQEQALPGTKPKQEFNFGGNVAIGAEHNSNLSVSELEKSSGTSDLAGTLDLNLVATWHPNEQLVAEGGYSLTSSRYQDLDNYDLDLHLLYGDLSYDFNVVTLGANYYFGKAYLGGDSFLELNQYSVYAGKLFADYWYVRGALNSVDKSFDTFTGRDADNDGFSLDLYRFFNEGKTSVSLSYVYEDEDTTDPAFRYTADTLRLRGSHRFTLMDMDARLQAGLRYQSRDYRYPTPGIGVPRDDSQHVFDLKLEMKLQKQLSLLTGWQHGNYDSRLPSADYTDNRYSVALQLSF